MGLTLETVVFYFLAVSIIAMSILTVTTQRIVRSATYLLFVLFGTAGIYFLLGYTFLGSVQIMVYAGGIVVLYVFSILLTSGEGDRAAHLKRSKFLAGLVTTIIGAILVLFITLTHKFVPTSDPEPVEISIKTIGHALLSSGKYGYVLPFEAVSILPGGFYHHDVCGNIRVLHPPQHTCYPHLCRTDAECYRYQLCRI